MAVTLILALFGVYFYNVYVFFAYDVAWACTRPYATRSNSGGGGNSDATWLTLARVSEVFDYGRHLYDSDPSRACALRISWTTETRAWWTMWTMYPDKVEHEGLIRVPCEPKRERDADLSFVEGCYHEMYPGRFHHFSSHAAYDENAVVNGLSRMNRAIVFFPTICLTISLAFLSLFGAFVFVRSLVSSSSSSSSFSSARSRSISRIINRNNDNTKQKRS